MAPMRRHRRSLIASAVAVALLATACTGDDDDSADSSPDTDAPADDDGGEPADDASDGSEPADDASELDGEGATIGFIRAPVGLFGILGAAQAGGLALAIQDVNDGGGVLGGPLAVSEVQPTPDLDVNAVFDELIADDVPLIVGPSSSEEALMLIPRLVEADAVICGASTTAPGLPETPEAEGRFLRTTFDDNIVAVNAFDRIRQQTASILDRAPKVTIVARGDAYGDSVSGALSSLLGIVGMEVTVLRYEPEDQLLDPVAADAAAAAGDVTVVISLAEGPRLASLIIDAGAPAPSVLGLDGLASPRFVGKADIDDPAPYQNLTVIGATGPLDFLSRLLEQPESQDEVIYAAQAYDCAVSFALAIEAVGSTDPTAVSQALRDVTGGGAVCTTYAECASQLRAGEDINYDGPSGPVDFTPEGEAGGGRILTSRLTGDLLRVVADLRITLDEIRSTVAPQVAGFIGDIQVALTQLGYYSGPIDGQQNEEFTAAVAAFQTDNGLEATGELNAETIAAIQDALAEQGLLLGASIRDVQQLLTELGYYSGPIDGLWSDELSQSIAAFQNDLGVQPTGILDEATLRAIYQAGFQSGGGGTTTTTVPASTTTTAAPATTAPPTTAAPTTTATTAPSSTTSTTTTTTVPADSVLGVLEANSQFSELVAVILSPGQEAVAAALSDPSAAITLFAPNNAAVPNDTSTLLADPALLTSVLQFHVLLENPNPLIDSATDNTALGPPSVLTIDATANTVGDGTTTANIIDPELPAGSGFVREIDAVLTPSDP